MAGGAVAAHHLNSVAWADRLAAENTKMPGEMGRCDRHAGADRWAVDQYVIIDGLIVGTVEEALGIRVRFTLFVNQQHFRVRALLLDHHRQFFGTFGAVVGDQYALTGNCSIQRFLPHALMVSVIDADMIVGRVDFENVNRLAGARHFA